MKPVMKSTTAAAIALATTLTPSLATAQNLDLVRVQRLCLSTPASCQGALSAFLARMRAAVANGTLSPDAIATTLGSVAAVALQAAREHPELAAEMADTLQAVASQAPSDQAAAITAVADRVAAGDIPAAEEISEAFASAN